MSTEPTLHDVISKLNTVVDAVTHLSERTEQRFAEAEKSQSEMLDVILAYAEKNDTQMSGLVTDIARIDERLTRVETAVVTKEYLDRKQAELYGQMLSVDKKVDLHVDAVVGVLDDHHAITDQEKARLMAMPPFPKLA